MANNVDIIIGVIFYFSAWLFLIGLYEVFIGWNKKSILFPFRPTLHRTTRIYKASSDNILKVDYGNMMEVIVHVDVPSKMIFFRKRTPFYRTGFIHTPWLFLGCIELSDLEGKSKAVFVGKPPFGFIYIFLTPKLLDIAYGFSGVHPDMFSFFFKAPMLILIIIAFVVEKIRFMTYVADIERLLFENDILLEEKQKNK